MQEYERRQIFLIVFLSFMLLVGLSLSIYRKAHQDIDVQIRNFNVEIEKEISLINVNEAGVEGLMRLKGVGKILAKRIIDYRNSNGLFSTKEDLKKVKGIGEALFENIKDDISVE